MAHIKNSVQGKSERKNLILLFFFITGLTGLIYELVWIRLLILAFGSTQFAITTVLVTFMAGLALGSLIFGRIVDKMAVPLYVYAAIEVVLGLYCIASPQVFILVRDLYVSFLSSSASGVAGGGTAAIHDAGFQWIQFILSFSALIIPTTLLGGTLPALVKYLASASGRVGFHTALPYAVNTLGAVAGCLATGFFLLYFLGLKATLYSAGVLDLIVGVSIYLLYCRGITGAKPAEKSAAPLIRESALPAKSRWNANTLIIAVFVVSGFSSLSYEVLWTRVFSLIIGSSVYAFTIMLATFLTGIGAGSILFAPYVDRVKRPLLWFAGLEAVIGFTGILSIFIYKKLPFIFYSLKGDFAEQFLLFQLIQFGLCATIIILPTLCMGAIFPLVGRIYTKGLTTVGKNIGDLYFSNTAGSIFGSFTAGFILIPFFGVQNGVTLTAALNIIIAILILYLTDLRAVTRGVLTVAFIAVFSVAALTLPPWERMVMTTGLYVNPMDKDEVESLQKGEVKDNLLYYREGINAVVTVRERMENNRAIRTYQANGKQEALSTDGIATGAWATLGHIPMLLHSGAPKDSLLVGLGAGITLGAMEYYPMEAVDVVEIEPAVVEAARFFSLSNNNALKDPRVRLHIADGRSFLFSTTKKYDVIISAVSDPWITGVANLFTFEYFSALRDKLKDGGTVAIWFQNYRATPEEVRIGLNTFAAVFPHISIWFQYTDALDLIVTGAMRPQSININELKSRFKGAGVRQGLSYIGMREPLDFFDFFLIGDDDLREYIGDTALNTDERPLIEFTLPRHLYMDPSSGTRNVEEILTHVKTIIPPLIIPDKDREGFYLALGKSFSDYSFKLPQALRAFNKVLEINPENSEAATLAGGLRRELGY